MTFWKIVLQKCSSGKVSGFSIFRGFRGFSSLSSNPRYSRSGLLRVKILKAYAGFPEVFPMERAAENKSWKV